MAEQNWNKLVAQILGAVLVLVGIVGFVPGITDANDMILGIFQTSLVHNIVHLLTGGVLLAGAMVDGGRNARMVNMVLGVVYLLVAVLGFVAADLVAALGVETNMADHVLHIGLGVVLLGVSFAMKESTMTASKM